MSGEMHEYPMPDGPFENKIDRYRASQRDDDLVACLRMEVAEALIDGAVKAASDEIERHVIGHPDAPAPQFTGLLDVLNGSDGVVWVTDEVRRCCPREPVPEPCNGVCHRHRGHSHVLEGLVPIDARRLDGSRTVTETLWLDPGCPQHGPLVRALPVDSGDDEST
jgi:hypothetical protein